MPGVLIESLTDHLQVFLSDIHKWPKKSGEEFQDGNVALYRTLAGHPRAIFIGQRVCPVAWIGSEGITTLRPRSWMMFG